MIAQHLVIRFIHFYYLNRYYFFCIIAFTLIASHLSAQDEGRVTWDELPSIPSISSMPGEGLAGHFADVHNDVLLVAGGTYFREKGRPWNGDSRIWNESIHVLERGNSGECQWLDTVFKLPVGRAYGASVSTPEGVLCIGGVDSSSYHTDVFLISWNLAKRTVETTNLPELPVPMAYMGAVLLDRSVYTN